jgi:hypothetical protein
MCPIRPSPRSDSTSESTGWRLNVSIVSVPMNSTAELVMSTRTSAPSFCSMRSNSTALYAAMDPVMPKRDPAVVRRPPDSVISHAPR